MPRYAAVADLRAELGMAATDIADDARLTAALDAAEATIDEWAGRRFDRQPASSRVLPSTTGLVEAPDIAAAGSVVVTGFAAIRLLPGSSAWSGRPYTHIELVGSRFTGSVAVTAEWGWPAVPAEVKVAAVIQAIRLYKRPQAPFGIAGAAEMGGGDLRLMPRIDPDVEQLLRPHRRHWWLA